MYDVYKIREDFPILRKKLRGKNIVYLDNAATSQKPVQVVEAISRYYREYNANIHRSAYLLAREATQIYDEARREVANFIGCDEDEVVFVRNTTEALNLIAYSWGLNNLRNGDEIILTTMDHHSNIVPWYLICSIKKCRIKFADITDDGYLNLSHLEDLLNPKTRIISVPHVSNVLGTINDVEYIAKLAHEYNALMIVDGAQSVPHMPVNVNKLDVDFLAFSGHKMLGPTGIGVLYGKHSLLQSLNPFMGGGDMIKSVECSIGGGCRISFEYPPRRYEAGTPNIAGAVGLMEAVRYLKRVGMDNVRRHEIDLTKYTLDKLSEVSGIEIYGPRDPAHKGGVIAFNLEGFEPHELAILLDQLNNVMVRSGLHCAQPLHMRLGIKASVRASFYLYNTKEEVDIFVETLKILSRKNRM